MLWIRTRARLGLAISHLSLTLTLTLTLSGFGLGSPRRSSLSLLGAAKVACATLPHRTHRGGTTEGGGRGGGHDRRGR